MKSEHGILPRKVARKPTVNHLVPKPKAHDESSPAAPGLWGGATGGNNETFAKPASPSPQPEGTDLSGDAFGTERTAGQGSEAEKLVLPSGQPGKRHRVNEIGTAGDPHSQNAAKTYHSSATESAGKVIRSAAGPSMLLPRRRRRRGEWGVKKSNVSFRWMLFTGLGVVGLVVGAVILNRPSAGGNARERSMFSQISPDETLTSSPNDDSGMMAMLLDGQDEAKRIFAKYATAESTGHFIGSVHRGEEMAELIGRNWEPLGLQPEWRPEDGAVWTVSEHEGLRYGTLAGRFPDFTPFNAIFRQGEDGLKMDWKATVGYSSADFGTLTKGLGDASEIRVWLSPADFHTYPLPEGTFRSFRLASPDGQENLWGYVKLGGELDTKLFAVFMPSEITGEARAQMPVILSLGRGPDESLPNQWMITKVVQLSWLE